MCGHSVPSGGRDIFLAALPVGAHTLTVDAEDAEDADGAHVTVERSFVVEALPPE